MFFNFDKYIIKLIIFYKFARKLQIYLLNSILCFIPKIMPYSVPANESPNLIKVQSLVNLVAANGECRAIE